MTLRLQKKEWGKAKPCGAILSFAYVAVICVGAPPKGGNFLSRDIEQRRASALRVVKQDPSNRVFLVLHQKRSHLVGRLGAIKPCLAEVRPYKVAGVQIQIVCFWFFTRNARICYFVSTQNRDLINRVFLVLHQKRSILRRLQRAEFYVPSAGLLESSKGNEFSFPQQMLAFDGGKWTQAEPFWRSFCGFPWSAPTHVFLKKIH